MLQRLAEKIALITGGNSGIGRATAKRFVAEGAHVFISGRRQSQLDAALQELGGSATGVQGDVSTLADLDRLFATIQEQKGLRLMPDGAAIVINGAMTSTRAHRPSASTP